MTTAIDAFPVLALLQQQAPSGPMALVQGLAPFVLIFVIFWFLLIRPARKRQQQHQAMLDALVRGDKVVTNGGLHGEIAAIEDKTVILKIADNVKVRVSRSAIGGKQGETDGGSST
jgi:preprotein translocase subunit YajC